MLKNCPNPVDVQDLQFKLHCRLKIFENKNLNTFNSPSLLSCASRYGLLFVGTTSSALLAIQIKCIESYSPKDKEIANYPRRIIPLPSPPRHICVNCDSTILAVVIEKDNCSTVIFYDVLSFLKQNVAIIKEARLSSMPGVYIIETNWNPALPLIFTACKSDGSLGVYEIKDNSISINELPAAAEATSFCWSPKGKQVAVGSRNGKITQYKPDLKAVKAINEPPLNGAHSLISLQWVSNYQFIGIYQLLDSEGSAKLIVVDAPKTGEVTYTNYEDVCYSGTSRPPQFYMILQQHWNILMAASANSTELGVLGSTGDMWTQWILSDTARAELPLSSDHQETLPVGLALDISSTTPLPWNESSIPPCPYLLILSHQGLLCIFNVVYLKEGVPSICTPPDLVSDTSGISQFVTMTTPQVAPVATQAMAPTFSFTPAQNATPSVTVTTPQVMPVATQAMAPTFSFAPAQNAPVSQILPVGPKVLPQPQPTYTAPSSLFGPKTTETKSLFGGQAVLTPINPQQPTTQTSIFGGQTFVPPINKLPTSSTSSTTTPTSDKYASIFAAVNAPVSVPAPIQTKPIVISMPASTRSEQIEQQRLVQPKPSISIPSGKLPEPKTTLNLKVKGEKDALLAQMIKDECVSLETELKRLLHRGRSSKFDVGTEDEKFDLVTKIESLQEFVKEIVDISLGENAEVHYLKQNLIQCWAWFEEARSRYNSSRDETISLLLRSQPLDSATEKRQQDIMKLMYYLESQISQASKALDEQWDNFQDYAKKTHRTKMPTMETIFQTMVRQNAVLQKQSYIMKDIASRLKSKSHIKKGPSLLISLENTKDLEDSLKRLQLDHPRDIQQLQYERVLRRMKNLSTPKTDKLRNFLKTREVSRVTAVKPQLSSSLVLQSPECKSKQLISGLLTLSTQVSPVSKTSVLPRQLNFVHSTPIREPSIDIHPTETPPNTPQIDAKTFTFKKIEKSNSASTMMADSNAALPVRTTSALTNLSQGNVNQSPSLPTHSLSAFVPTTQITYTAGAAVKPFSFAPAITTTTTVLKSDLSGAETAAPAFSLVATTPVLSKFGSATVPKTASTPKTTPTLKTTLPQFNFGSSISITPITISNKPDSATSSTPTVQDATAKSGFSFGGTNMFGSKDETSVTGKTEITTAATTSTSLLFGGLSQSSKPLFGTTSSSGTFSFGATSGMSKISAFTAVTTSLPSSTVAPHNTSLNTQISKQDVPTTAITQPSVLTSNVTTAPSIFGSQTSAINASNTITTRPVSMFSSDVSATKPPSFFSTPAPTSTTVASPLATANTSFLGNLMATTQSSSVFPTSASLTIPAAVVASTTPTTSSVVTTTAVSTLFSVPEKATTAMADSPKPSGISSPLFSSSVTSASSTTQPTSIFGTAVTTSKPSIFGTSPTEGSIFAAASSPKQQQQSSIFSNTPNTTQPSIFGASVPATTAGSLFGGTATIQPSIFGASSAVTTTSGSIFGNTPTPTSQPSLFEKPPSSPTTGSIFSTPTTTTSSIFGSSIAPTTTTSIFATTAPSIFGSTAATQPSIFGTSTAPTTTSSVFGGTTTTQSSIFGAPISSEITKPSISGTTQPSIFGATTVVSTPQSSIFGGGANTNQTSIFGTAAGTTPQATAFGGAIGDTTKPIFGGTTSASVSQPSVFASSSVPSTQPSLFSTNAAASPFGASFGAAVTTATSPFGQSTSIFSTSKTTESPFGSSFGSSSVFGSTPTTTAAAFGQPATFGSGSPTVFGAPTTSTNVFGSAAPSGSTFGVTSSTANVFGSPPVSSSFSFAGAANNAGNVGSFGFGGLNVGAPATTSGSIFGSAAPFGSPPPQANPFGRPSEQKSSFGGNVFGSPASTSSSIFGGGTSSVFGSNTQSGFGTSTFGSPSAFGQQSTFGQNSFGNTSFGSTPGPFSRGGAAVGQTGFGSPASFQKPSGFGSSPVFGGSPPQPAFGSAASFGGAPAFGAAPAFGSPNKVFGSNTSTGFGGAPAANTGFGNLATQNTVGFGSLAQQAATANSAPFSGSSSFSSWR